MPVDGSSLTVASDASPIPLVPGDPSLLRVRLVNAFRDPYNNAIAAARSCYSPVLVSPEDVARDEKARAQRDAIAESTYRAGHHTVLQHATFQFSLENVSRHFLWSFLHSHPFYNSEQVSQRYVTVSPERVVVPPLDDKARALYLDTASALMAAYSRLAEVLRPRVLWEYRKLFPLRNADEGRWARVIRRKAQEAARYVLPVATHAHLYHTVSGLTLHRYHRLCQGFDTPWEQRRVVGAMVEAVRAADPLFVDRLEDPLSLESTPEYRMHREFHGAGGAPARDFLDEFDRRLGSHRSRLVDHKAHGEAVLAQSVRTVLGLPKAALTDDEAIDRVLNPARNPLLSESLNLLAHDKLGRTLCHMHFTFAKKLSHAADSQDQRHRLTPGSRPVLSGHFVPEKPDYIVPDLIASVPEALEIYEETLEGLWGRIGRLLGLGVPMEFASYLLPNAVAVRFEESGDLTAFHHKWTKRLCYNAQEEIWRSCREEVQQVARVAPRVARHLGAPCALRQAAGARPFCPEGDRFCGVLVWNLPVDRYERTL